LFTTAYDLNKKKVAYISAKPYSSRHRIVCQRLKGFGYKWLNCGHFNVLPPFLIVVVRKRILVQK
jgi:hypothetical protein